MDPKVILDNFLTIVKTKYFCFEGRADRTEFWQYVLVNFIAGAVFGIIPKIGPILLTVWALALLLPSLGVTARRLHDTGKSGWFQLVAIIPVIGVLVLLLVCIPEGSKEANAYGEPVVR